MKELARQPWSWVLYEASDGRLVLSVSCGTVAIYEIFIELTDEESRSVHSQGHSAIDALAREVTANPHRFGPRNVKLQGDEVVPAPLS